MSLLLALVFQPISPAQTGAPQTPKPKEQKGQSESLLRLETELVQIDVVVSDERGNLVRDLKREDFELIEDGKPQQITHFAVGTAAQPATWLRDEPRPKRAAGDAAATAQPVEVRAGRYIVLAVDDLHLAPENLILAKRALLRFIERQVAGGDQVAVVTTSGVIGLFQQFTSERAVLERAINRLSVQNRKVTHSFEVPRITDYQAELIDLGDPDALELAVQEILRQEGQPITPPTGVPAAAGPGAQAAQAANAARARATMQAQARARAIVAENVNFTKATLSTLEAIIRTLRSLPGRKLMVLLSDGFFLGGSRYSQHYDVRRITDAATRAGVVIYSLDARGLIATPPGGDASDPLPASEATTLPGARARIESSAIEAKRNGLNALARDTGGFPIFNNNDISLGLQRVLNDNETYYVLAYEPAVSYRDGRFHQIEVRVSGRPGLRVRTRKGYFAPAEKPAEKIAEKAAEKPKEKSPEKVAKEAEAAKQEQFRAGISSLFPLRGIPVEMTADFIHSAEQGALAAITAQITASGLNFQEVNGTQHTRLELVGLIFDEKGKLAGNFSERVELNLRPRAFELALKNGLSYRRLSPLKPGFYQVRLAVLEEGTAQLGSAAQWVEISDLSKKQLTLSGVFLSSNETNANESLTPASSSNNDLAGYQPRPSQASRRFKRDGSLDFLLMVYNAKRDDGQTDLVIQSQVFSGSKLIYASPLSLIPSPSAAEHQAPYAARLSLTSFEPGEYELRLLVIDRLAKTTAHRRVNFTIE